MFAEAKQQARRDVPKVVRMLLAVSGRTARELAEATGMSESKVSERLSGKTRISSDELASWAAFLEVDPGLLYRSPTYLRDALTQGSVPRAANVSDLHSGQSRCTTADSSRTTSNVESLRRVA